MTTDLPGPCGRMESVVCGGEAFPADLFEKVKKCKPCQDLYPVRARRRPRWASASGSFRRRKNHGRKAHGQLPPLCAGRLDESPFPWACTETCMWAASAWEGATETGRISPERSLCPAPLRTGSGCTPPVIWPAGRLRERSSWRDEGTAR